MRLHSNPLAGKGASCGPEDKVEGVLGVDGQAANLGAVHLHGSGDRARLLAVAVKAQGYQVGGRQLDGVPLQNDRGLCGIAAAEDRGGGLTGAEGAVYLVLELAELLLCDGLLGLVLADGDVDDAAG